ncbi:ABC transporter, ATP-binding protein [Chitinispirillum alkaliphilum]|nr:ABC transporter, ATP-binding protein [Chitinispirillum alkaliphilum]
MISFESISKQFGESVLFDEVSFSFNESHRTGLIGSNGSGKTTILRMLAGTENPDSGSISIPPGISVGYLPQEIELFEELTPMEIVLQSFKHLLEFEQSLIEAAQEIEDGNQNGLRMLEELQTEMEQKDGYAIKSKAEMILTGLGFSAEQLNKRIETLSGGYRMRAVLGRLLLEKPDYLLLDEPTNHLDFDSLIWLENFLSRYQGGLLVVSHDRDFLNRITTHTASITNRKIRIYKGNYSTYLKLREEENISAQSRIKNIKSKIAQNERFVERFKAKATKATQAQSRVKQIEMLKSELPEEESEEKSIRFTFSIPKESGSVPLKLNNISTGYNDQKIIENLYLEIRRGDRIAIIGPNGAGKSTLLKVLAGIQPVWQGEFEVGHNTITRYFGQHQLEQLDLEKSALETVAQHSASTEKNYIRGILGSFLFSGDSVEKKVGVLSGGEKSRLVLATILASPGNTLLLDEPTNHLDVRSIEMLSDSMADYKGTIAFVSHDEYFISKVANRIIEVRPGLIRDFPGTLSDYRYYLETLFQDKTQKDENSGNSPKNSQNKENRIKTRENRKKLCRKIEKYEKEIEARESEIADIELILHDSVNATNYQLLNDKTTELKCVRSELDALIQKWEESNLELESVSED